MTIYNNDSLNYVCEYVGIIGSLENLEERMNSFAYFYLEWLLF